MLNLNISNDFEALQKAFCENIEKDPPGVFSEIDVIVPSTAIKQKLTLAIADRTGICAGINFTFLGLWAWRQISKLDGNVGKTSPFSSEIMAWRILKQLKNDSFKKFPRLSGYLERADDTMRYEFACRLAHLFERYMLHRSEWIAAWSKGKKIPEDELKASSAVQDQEWQAEIWRAVEAETLNGTGTPGVNPIHEYLDRAEKDPKTAKILPRKVYIFMQPALQPLYANMLKRLGKLETITIELYVLSPCMEEDWFERETENSLLASWGNEIRSSLKLLFCNTPASWNIRQIGTDKKDSPDTLLSRLQKSIREGRNPGPGDFSGFGESDSSIEIHSAHSLRREIEILHDQILRRLDNNASIPLQDILVAVPDIDEAAPHIETVFSARSGEVYLPYRIAGRKNSRINPVSRALSALIEITSSRFTAQAVKDLMMLPEIAGKFGFTGKDQTIHRMMKESGIRWGLDGAHKSEIGLPENDRHTFHDGISRLFLSFSLPQDKTGLPFAGILPEGRISSDDAVLLGRIENFIEELNGLRESLSIPKNAAGWKETWLGILDKFILPEPNAQNSDRETRERITSLCETMETGLGNSEVSPETARKALDDALEESAAGAMISGAVTFAPLNGMRGLSYRQIYIIGLNDGTVPENSRTDEFDLMQSQAPASAAHTLEAGKNYCPSRRDTDKNNFLDLILAARDSLYLSYTGQSEKDNSEVPPSVLVAELLDILIPAMKKSDTDDDEALFRHLFIRHPLQPFSEEYFKEGKENGKLVSYREDICGALIESRRNKTNNSIKINKIQPYSNDEDEDDFLEETGPSEPFFNEKLPPPDERSRHITLDDLISFFCHPSQYLIEKMGIRFSKPEEEIEPDEPMVKEFGKDDDLAKRTVPLFLEGRDEKEILEAALAGNEYPSGLQGRLLIETELKNIKTFSADIANAAGSPPVQPVNNTLDFDIPPSGSDETEKWTLSGRLDGLRENGLLLWQYNPGWPRTRLAAWIRHLFLSTSKEKGLSRRSTWYFWKDGLTETLELAPLSANEAKEKLKELVEIYRDGQTRPIPFFPKAAWAYISTEKDPEKAAKSKWEGKTGDKSQDDSRKEKEDPYNRLALRGRGDLFENIEIGEEFKTLAKTVFGPLKERLLEKENEYDE